MDIAKIKNHFLPMSETMFYILSSLREERHGYGIMQYVRQLTRGRVTLGAGTVYQSLSKLEREGLITATVEQDRRKQYIITEVGREVLRAEAERLFELYTVAKELI